MDILGIISPSILSKKAYQAATGREEGNDGETRNAVTAGQWSGLNLGER